MQFPKDLSSKYYLSIDFRAYSRTSPLDTRVSFSPSSLISNARNNSLGSSSRGGGDSIKLPMPATMVDSQSLNWSVESMNGVSELLYSNEGSTWGKIGQVLGAGAATALQNMGGSLSGPASGVTGAALQQAGLAINPLLTVLFKHPEFRTHQFTWTLSPNSLEESKELKSIIETLRQASLPNNYGAFFGYPDIAMIRYSNQDQLYKFQPSVITNVTSNYAPSGTPSFFEGERYPNMVNLTISFLEIVLNTRESYGSMSPGDFFSVSSSTITNNRTNNQLNN